MTLTRRETSKLILSGGALAATTLPAAADLIDTPSSWSDRLEARLEDLLAPGRPGRLSLVSTQVKAQNRSYLLAAHIRLDWPPGFRTVVCTAQGTTEEAALDRLTEEIRAAFSSL